MGDVLFYHLTASSAEETLHQLLPRALERGWQVTLRCPDQGAAERLDVALWHGPEESFLPHGLATGSARDARQPVLICWDEAGAASDRPCVMAVGGTAPSPEVARDADRVCILFDGHDPDAVARARDQWRAVTGAGLVAQYWAQEGRSWQKKAESGGA